MRDDDALFGQFRLQSAHRQVFFCRQPCFYPGRGFPIQKRAPMSAHLARLKATPRPPFLADPHGRRH